MMSSRNINNLPAHGAPSRDDFAKLDERQRDQINDVVCCLASPSLELRDLARATPRRSQSLLTATANPF